MAVALMLASWLVASLVALPAQKEYAATLEEVTKLHIGPEENPRSNPWGGGMIEQEIETDVFVAGGGSAGTAAAIAAARSGMRTVLVNGPGVLGGNAGSQIRVTQAGACGPRHGQAKSNQVFFRIPLR